MRVLLLNPPSKPPVLRDLSCGETAKASYYWEPIDLLVLSARIPSGTEVSVLDATAERLSAAAALERACGAAPDLVLSLVAAVSLDGDLRFLSELGSRTGAEIAVMGDVASFTPGLLEPSGFIDAVLPDFTHEGLLPYLAGERSGASGLLLREGPGLEDRRSRPSGELAYGIPRHDLFPLRRYAMPYSLHRPVATMMLSYGCPYRCAFCASGRLTYRPRSLADFLAEYEVVASMGVREFFLRDLTFGVERERALDMCRALAGRRRMAWSCEARLDTVDAELLSEMKRAGCHLVMLGVESADPDILRGSGKGAGAKASEVFRAARRAGLSTLAHFIIGFPDDTRESIERTVEMAASLESDFASFNLMVPRLGSGLREALVASGRVSESDLSCLDCTTGGRSLCGIPAEDLARTRRRAVLRFYSRPSRLLGLFGRSLTPAGLFNLLRNGAGVLLGR
ncbi:radical SAM protein [Candidatus Fermentibacteria bacterium]|nr:radical SAM protein [Candidatus Fermentibacteria bacterium]